MEQEGRVNGRLGGGRVGTRRGREARQSKARREAGQGDTGHRKSELR